MELQSNKFHIESAIKIIRRRIINFANSFFAAIVIWNIYEREDIFLIDSSHCAFFMLLLLGNIFNLNSDCSSWCGFYFLLFFRKQSVIIIRWKRNTTAILAIKSDKMMKHKQNHMIQLISWKNNTKLKRNTLKFVETSLYLIASSGLSLKSRLHSLLRKYLHLMWKTLEIFMISRLTKNKLIRLIGLKRLRKSNPGQFSSLCA